ncbi:MAG: YqaJ viral recombinase family protein [Pseudomonadota bacterium]
MTVTIHHDLIQGTEEWLAARRGLITASEMNLLLTPTLKTANNDKSRAHVWELAAQRISGYVEPGYISDDMLRGWNDEIEARRIYDEKIARLGTVGFITNDKWGFELGYSPDALVGDDGLIEVKSRRQKYQIETIHADAVPTEYALQLQTGLLVSERKWIDFISYSGGLPMVIYRVFPDDVTQAAIIEVAGKVEQRIAAVVMRYWTCTHSLAAEGRAFPTERKVEQEMIL